MTEIELTNSELIVNMKGIDKVLALKSQVRVPLGSIEGVWEGVDPETQEEFNHSLRLPGSYMPGIAIAGTYVHKDKKQFWNIHHKANAIVIKLNNEKYDRLVLEVEDPSATVAAIKQATGK